MNIKNMTRSCRYGRSTCTLTFEFFVIVSLDYVKFTKKIINIYSFLFFIIYSFNSYSPEPLYCNRGHNGPIHEMAVIRLNLSDRPGENKS